MALLSILCVVRGGEEERTKMDQDGASRAAGSKNWRSKHDRHKKIGLGLCSALDVVGLKAAGRCSEQAENKRQTSAP